MNGSPAQQPWWRRLTQLAVFPLLVYLVLTQLIRENYPFSHYPMYSRPNSKALGIQFLADGDGKPLPVVWHTGVSPSKVAKLHGAKRIFVCATHGLLVGKAIDHLKDPAIECVAFTDPGTSRRGTGATAQRPD